MTYVYRRQEVGIPANAKEYLNKKKRYSSLLLLFDYLFSTKESISIEEKDKETLRIISKW